MARLLACSVLLIGLAPAATLAGPLLPEQCEKLTAQVAALNQAGVKAVLEKGPAASRAALTKEMRDQIRAYLDGLGQLRFRCPNDAPFVTLKPEPPEDPADAGSTVAPIEAGSPGITLPAGVAAAVVAPIVPKKPAEPKAGTPAPPAKAAAKTAPPKADPAKVEPAKAQAKPTSVKAPPPLPANPAIAAPAATQPAAATQPPPTKPKAAPKAKADDAFRPAQPASDGKAP